MNFGKFIRKYSTDTENENSSNRSSLISGTSKLFDSVNTKTTSLVSGLSNTFEQIKRRTSVESLSFTDKEGSKLENNDFVTKPAPQSSFSKSGGYENSDEKLPYQDARTYIEQANQFHNVRGNQVDEIVHDSSVVTKKLPPPKPPPPLTKQMSTPHEEDRSQNRETFSRSQTVAEREYVNDNYQNEYLKMESGQIANDAIEGARSHLEMECQKIVLAMDDLISFDPVTNRSHTVNERNSSPSEYGDTGDQPIYEEKSHSERRVSDTSIDSGTDEINEQQREFLNLFVSDLFREGFAQKDQMSMSKFKKCLQSKSGRGLFVKLVERNQHLNSKEVPETVFYHLLQVFTIVLLECHEFEDFLPARDLMLVAFGCFTVLQTLKSKVVYSFYLSSFISCHPIWKSTQYWNVCFYNAVKEVRSKRSITRRNSTNTTDADGVAFHQLQVHLNYMRSLGLPVELCSGFVEKQVDIVNLTEDEMRRLKEVMESWKG